MAVNLQDGRRRTLADFRGRPVDVIAGIGHPEAFFAALRSLGLEIVARPLPDHAVLDEASLAWARDATVLMTEKDAVKCRGFARPGWWFVDLDVHFEPPSAADELVARVLDGRCVGIPFAEVALDSKLLDILACPVCKGPLRWNRDSQQLVCRGDRLAFPVRDGIPVMLEDEAQPLAADDPLLRD